MSIVYLNGEFESSDQAKISVFDRGFLLGDGVYEVIPVYGGTVFRMEAHLNRLQNSLDAIRLINPHTLPQWQDIFSELVLQNPYDSASIYLQVTRGIAERDHAFPAGVEPTVFAMVNKISPLTSDYYESGVAAISLLDNRWLRCNIKAISLLPNVLLRQQAVDQGVIEAILIREGKVTEGAASNVFAVIDNEIITPPKSQYLLPGITRDLVMELAELHGIPNSEQEISLTQLQQADEIWLSSSTKEILPVTRLDDKVVGSGQPGEIWRRMAKIYAQFKTSLGTEIQ